MQPALPSDPSFRSLQRIAFPSYLWVMSFQISQFSPLRLCSSPAFLLPFFRLVLADRPGTRDFSPCVDSFFIPSVLCSTLGGSSSGNSLAVLLECVHNKCFLMLERLSVLVPLGLKLGWRVYLTEWTFVSFCIWVSLVEVCWIFSTLFVVWKDLSMQLWKFLLIF